MIDLDASEQKRPNQAGQCSGLTGITEPLESRQDSETANPADHSVAKEQYKGCRGS